VYCSLGTAPAGAGRFTLLALVVLAAVVGGCVTKQDNSMPVMRVDGSLVETVRSGKATLGCGTDQCERAWNARRRFASEYVRQMRWAELAATVLATDYASDLTYFYLARAADGLGAPRASLAYYNQARQQANGPRTCQRTASCDGVDVAAQAVAAATAIQRRQASAPRPTLQPVDAPAATEFKLPPAATYTPPASEPAPATPGWSLPPRT
jgi:hypothetical protein